MNQVILNVLAPEPAIKSGATSHVVKGTRGPADPFGSLLGGKLKVAPASIGSSAPAASATQTAALEAKIKKLLKSGMSDRDVRAALAGELAASVAQALGPGAGADGRAQLSAVFTKALGPPGPDNEPPADRIRSLAQRFTELQDIAAGIVGTSNNGQQNRFAGTFSDAKSAKEIPALAPVTTAPVASHFGPAAGVLPAIRSEIHSTVIAVTTVLPSAASDGAPATVATATSAPVAAATPSTDATAAVDRLTLAPPSDARSVSLPPDAAIATGGATALGRVLGRAVLAADARDAAASGDEGMADGGQAGEVPATGTASGATSPAVGALAKFIAAFETAARTSDALARANADAGAPGAPSATSATAHAPAESATGFLPAAAPFAIERAAPAGTPPGPVPAAPVDQSAIVDQVLRGTFLRNTGQSSEMRLSLVPESLGDVNVKLIVSGGSVTAHVLAATPEVRDALAAAVPQLTKALADAGLKLQTFTVDLSGNGFAGSSHQPRDGGQSGGRARRATVFGDDDGDEALEAVPTFGPPLSAPGLGDYNYLA